VANHKKGGIRLKRLQVAAWKDELFRNNIEVIGLHREYTEDIPDLTDQQRKPCDKWEVQLNTDHEAIIQFTIRYATSSSQCTRFIWTSHQEITTSAVTSRRVPTQFMLTGSSPQVSYTEF
jgi:hypothetical protein